MTARSLPPGTRRTMAHAGALMYAAGAVLSLGAVALPHPPELHVPGMLAGGGVAGAMAIAYLVFGKRLPRWTLTAGPFVGSAVISLQVYFGGGRVVSAAFAMLYVWVAVYVAYFETTRVLTWSLAVGHVLHAVALFATPGTLAPFTIWLFALATSVVGSLMVVMLVRRLRLLARSDELTGAVNRRTWDEILAQEVYRADREGEPLSIALADVDHFKKLNDTWGHQFGDVILRRIATSWTGELRTSDTLARFGGDEFAVILPRTGQEEAAWVVERLRSFLPDGVGVSVGVATWRKGEGSDDLLRRADEALARAKQSGRGLTIVAGLERVDA